MRKEDMEKVNNDVKDLTGADLSYAILSGANLSGADLSYADLSYANLSYADLSYADLSYANLSHANLSYADLRWINSTEGVEGKQIIEIQVDTSVKNRKIRYFIDEDIITAGCFQGSFEEFKKRVDDENKHEYYDDVIEFIEKRKDK